MAFPGSYAQTAFLGHSKDGQPITQKNSNILSFDDISLTQVAHPTLMYECDGDAQSQNYCTSSSYQNRVPVIPSAPKTVELRSLERCTKVGRQYELVENCKQLFPSKRNSYEKSFFGPLDSPSQSEEGNYKRKLSNDKFSFDLPLTQLLQSQINPELRGHKGNNEASIMSAPKVPTMPARGQPLFKKSSESFQVPPQKASTKSPQLQVQKEKTRVCPIVSGVQLRALDEIQKFQGIFNFPYFNVLQSLILEEVLYTDKSLVASAPTGSGKTVIFELALIRLLTKTEGFSSRGKIVYMAPMKALCSERFVDWSKKFGGQGITCLEVTGDSELEDPAELVKANLICTTPEKWDSMSRRWKDNKALFQQIQLFLIDEVHVLNDPHRGATVEAVISRMKTLEISRDSGDMTHIRFVAVSATMPNYQDVADWLGTLDRPASAFNLGEEYRPVKLERTVLGYPFKEGTSDFRFDMNLSYRLKAIIETRSHNKPTLVFCSSRKSVVQTAEALARDMRTNSLLVHFNAEILHGAAKLVHEHKLSELLHTGIGIHHAGLDAQDRKTVEDLFKTSELPVLISTSTLAMGVNLPAHLVIIKSTHFYNMGVVQEYSDMQILQMIGRAGRPQFDTSAAAVIMTKAKHKTKYSTLMNGTQLIESSLHKNLIEHLNAEIVLETISDMTMVVEWIRHTFLYVRVLKNPCHYGLPSNLTTQQVEKRLQELCLQNVQHLTSENLVSINGEQHTIWPTDNGRLMARYCIAFETMKQFGRINESQESLADMLNVISQCAEFEDIQLRINEKRILNSLNRDKNKETIRFPLTGKIKTKQMKVNCLIQTQLSCLPVQDFSLSQDMAKIFRVGQRITKCLMEFMFQQNNFSTLLHSTLVYKAFKTKLWFDSKYVARQLDGIGPATSLALANAGLSSFQKLEQANPRDIEVIVNRNPPFGSQIKEAISALPRYQLAVEQVKCYKPNKCVLTLIVDLLNRSVLENIPSSHITHQSFLIVGDADNNIVFKWRIFDANILRDGPFTRTAEVLRASAGTKLTICVLSLNTVGLDIQTEYEPFYTDGWFQPSVKSASNKAQTPASKLRASMDNAKRESTSVCNHKCGDKSSCGHKCCKSTGKIEHNKRSAGAMSANDGSNKDKDKSGIKVSKVGENDSYYKKNSHVKEMLSKFNWKQPEKRITLNRMLPREDDQKNSQHSLHASVETESNQYFGHSICDTEHGSDVITKSESSSAEEELINDVIVLDGDDFDDDDDFDLQSSCLPFQQENKMAQKDDLTPSGKKCQISKASNFSARLSNPLMSTNDLQSTNEAKAGKVNIKKESRPYHMNNEVVNHEPIILDDDSDELPSLTNTPEPKYVDARNQSHLQKNDNYLVEQQKSVIPMSKQQRKFPHMQSPWTGITSSDEELCLLDDNISSTYASPAQDHISGISEGLNDPHNKPYKSILEMTNDFEVNVGAGSAPLQWVDSNCEAENSSSRYLEAENPNSHYLATLPFKKTHLQSISVTSANKRGHLQTFGAQRAYSASSCMAGSKLEKLDSMGKVCSKFNVSMQPPSRFHNPPLVVMSDSDSSSVLSGHNSSFQVIESGDFDSSNTSFRKANKVLNCAGDASVALYGSSQAYGSFPQNGIDLTSVVQNADFFIPLINDVEKSKEANQKCGKDDPLSSIFSGVKEAKGSKQDKSDVKSSHRFGHVLAWNKNSNNQSGHQISTGSKQQDKQQNTIFLDFFDPNPRDGLNGGEAAGTTANLFDGIF